MIYRFHPNRQMAKTEGLMGIVKAEAPTETRTRHTALLAGFNEDLFNLWGGKLDLLKSFFLGWKKNLRPFESILHTTQFSWAYGDPVAIKPFILSQDDPRSSRLKAEYYPEGGHSSQYADNFVLEKFKVSVGCMLLKSNNNPI